MKELFVPYELALLAKEKGFDEPCFGYSTANHTRITGCRGNITIDEFSEKAAWRNTQEVVVDKHIEIKPSGIVIAPLYQQLTDWFREKHQIHISVGTLGDEKDFPLYNYSIVTNHNSGVDNALSQLNMTYEEEVLLSHKDYYQALNKALEEAFKLIP